MVGTMPWDFKTQQGNSVLDTKRCSPVSAGLFLTALPSAIGSSAAASDLLNSSPIVFLAARALYVTGKGAAARQEFPRFLTPKPLSPRLCIFLPATPGERSLHVAGATSRGRRFSLIFSETMSVHHLSSQALCGKQNKLLSLSYSQGNAPFTPCSPMAPRTVLILGAPCPNPRTTENKSM